LESRSGRRQIAGRLLLFRDQQIVPTIGRIADLQPLGEDGVGIGLRPSLARSAFVVQPAVDDHLCLAVPAEEQAKPAEELYPEPVLVTVPQRRALPEGPVTRIGRDFVQQNVDDPRQEFGLGVCLPALRVGVTQRRHIGREARKLAVELLGGEQRPAIPNGRRPLPHC
jgi:hypothetical protein